MPLMLEMRTKIGDLKKIEGGTGEVGEVWRFVN